MRMPFPFSTAPHRTLAIVASFAFLALAGCSESQPAATAKPPASPAAPKGDDHAGEEGGHAEGAAIKLSEGEMNQAGVRVEPATEQEVADQLVVTATILANQDRLARISPRVPGRVVKVHASLGDRVGAGQVLAVLDSIEVGEARSAHAQAESEERVARANLERAQRLQVDQIVSQKDFLRAKAEHDKAHAALRAAADKLQMLGVGAGGDSVSTLPVSAPFAGTIIEKKAVIGELAQPDRPLFAVADLSVLWIEANLAEKDLPKIRAGDAAVVTVTAYPKERFTGKLTYIGDTVDRETRTIRGRIEVRNADGRLKPEMFASAAIQTAARSKAIVVPDEAVVLMSGQPVVFVEEHEGFEPRAVQLGERVQGRIVVRSGLKPADLVVVAGTYAIKARALKATLGEGHAH
ncbi:MAG: efflux RND transporter periplasmic adaptor subunit [Burkholderiales bacterium]|nr:efflux RND transporter periplasmic adaptor subunit [Burkholderiales bacterium]